MFGKKRVKTKLKQFLSSWVEYRDLMLEAPTEGEELTKADARFLKLKAKLATDLQALEESAPNPLSGEAHREFGIITDLLKRYKSLEEKKGWSESDCANFERRWHEQYIWLNKLKGATLKKNTTRPLKQKAAAVPTGLGKSWVPRRFTPGRYLRAIISTVLFILVIFIVGWGFGIHWEKGPGFVTENGSVVGKALVNLLNGVQTIWHYVIGFFSPVVATYGLGWSVLLLSLLVLASGFWVFARG